MHWAQTFEAFTSLTCFLTSRALALLLTRRWAWCPGREW